MQFINKKYRDNYKIDKSPIEGWGIIAQTNFAPKQIIGVGIYYIIRLFPIITHDLGSWINHSDTPNCRIIYSDKDDIYEVVAIKNIPTNTEITIDYKDTPWYIVKTYKNN